MSKIHQQIEMLLLRILIRGKRTTRPKGSKIRCNEYQGARHPYGHGHIVVRSAMRKSLGLANTRQQIVSRVIWSILKGPILDGLLVRHKVCDNPPCFEIRHLKLGTSKQNARDMIRHGRWRNKLKKEV